MIREDEKNKDSGATPQRSMEAGQAVHADQLTHVAPTYTPGPWGVVRHNHVNNELWLSVNAGREGEMRPWIAEIKYLTTSEPEQWANAHLIAAAPELYEALKAIQGQCSGHADEFSRNVYVLAEAALAKASGRS